MNIVSSMIHIHVNVGKVKNMNIVPIMIHIHVNVGKE
jgi:hypothetical protein